MNNLNYEMVIYWDARDSIYVVEVPELPGCMAHGASRREAVRQAEEAIASWVLTAKEDGVEMPAPRGKLMFAWGQGANFFRCCDRASKFFKSIVADGFCGAALKRFFRALNFVRRNWLSINIGKPSFIISFEEVGCGGWAEAAVNATVVHIKATKGVFWQAFFWIGHSRVWVCKGILS